MVAVPDEKPLISVIIPTYNRAGSLGAAIDSALAQDYMPIEIIVVDDASTDNTAVLLQQYPSLHLIRHETNKGAAAARNTGIAVARGDYIALLDSDDLWLPGKLSAQLDYLQKTGAILCTCDALFARGDGQSSHAERALPRGDLTRSVALGLGVNAGSTLCARRDIFTQVGMFDEDLPRLEDWDWFIRYTQLGHKFASAPFFGAVIQVGGAPSVSAVQKSVDRLRDKHGDRMGDAFKAALALELAAARLWQKDISGFVVGWFRAFVSAPAFAVSFLAKRLLRLINGDAPRVLGFLLKGKLKDKPR